MEFIVITIKSLIKYLGGSFFCFAVILIYALSKFRLNEKVASFFNQMIQYGVIAFFVIFFVSSIFYLFYPNFLNHVEPTVASIGLAMKRGEHIYPLPYGSYPYSGILYGPLLFIIQMFFHRLGLNEIIGSKLPGIIAFAVAALFLWRLKKDWFYRGYLLYLFPFGIILFWNRSDSFFLLLVSLALFIANRYAKNKYTPFIVGVLGGLASALKLHGLLYIFIAYLCVNCEKINFKAIFLFFISSFITFFIIFLPENITLEGFWAYIFKVQKQGFSLQLWWESFIYLIFLFIPFYILRNDINFKKLWNLNIFFIFAIEFLITIVASKRGNGFYHLLPLIPVNAIILSSNINGLAKRKDLITIFFISLIFINFYTVFSDFILPFTKSWHMFNEAKKEIISLTEKRPNIVMGVTDDNGYPYSFFRVILNGRQIDYASYMDLQVSGIDDREFYENMKSCKICCMLIPNKGIPFTLNNYYTLKPMFSDKIRKTFEEMFCPEKRGNYFTVYRCKKDRN